MLEELTRTYSGKCPNCDGPMLFHIKTDFGELEFYAQGIVDCPQCKRNAQEIHTKSYSAQELFRNVLLKPLWQQEPETQIRTSATCTFCGQTESFPVGQWEQPCQILEENGWRSGVTINEEPQMDTVKCPACIAKECKPTFKATIMKQRPSSINPSNFKMNFDWDKKHFYDPKPVESRQLAKILSTHKKMQENELLKMLTPPRKYVPK